MELVAEKYKKTEVGLIPRDWQVKKLGEIGENIIGLTYSPNDVRAYGHLVLRSSNIQNNKLAFENNVFVKMELPQRVIVKEDDILICVRNGSKHLIGKCALIDKQTAGCAFGAFMSVYRTDFANYIFHQFQSYIIQKQIDEVMGATINQLTNKDLAIFQIPFPPNKTEQTAIATSLTDANALISSLENLIAKKRNIKQGALQKLLQPKDGWELKKLEEVCDVRDGTHDSPKYIDNGVIFVTSKNIIDGRLNFTDVSFISKEDSIQINQRSKVDKGDILMSMIGTIGNAVLIDFEPDFCIKNVALLKPKKINTIYLLQLIYSQGFQKYIESKLDGGIQKFISLGVLRDLDIPSPSIQEQTRIANILSDMDAEISALETKLEKYKKVKLGMMQNLLTGKIRLV